MAAARILIIYTGGTIGMGKNVETGITVLFHSNDIYRIPLKLNETINSTSYLHHSKDYDGNYHKEQELDITIYTVKEVE